MVYKPIRSYNSTVCSHPEDNELLYESVIPLLMSQKDFLANATHALLIRDRNLRLDFRKSAL